MAIKLQYSNTFSTYFIPIWSKNFIEVKAAFGASVSGGLSVLAMLVPYNKKS